MLHAIIIKLPEIVVDQHSRTFFIFLVKSLANDHDKKVRSMAGAAIKLLIKRVSSHCCDAILQYCLTWYEGGNSHLWSTAAQVGHLFYSINLSVEKFHIV